MVDRCYSPTNVREQAEQVLKAWAHIDEEKLGQFTRAEFAAAVAELDVNIARREALLFELREVSQHIKDGRRMVWLGVMGARAVVAANYGRDSLQFHHFGGTRYSRRRTPHGDGDKQSPTDNNTSATTDTDSQPL